MTSPRTTRKLLALLAGGLVAGAALLGMIGSAHGAAPAPILPNIVADPVDGFELQQASFSGKNHLLLKFNGYIHNKGPGAVDFRGSRSAPTIKKSTLEAIEHHATFSPEQEAELANPPMKTTQRLFTTSSEQTNPNRVHVEEASSGKLIYSSADGHNHWHLQEIARYTLMNGPKTETVAPAQKVGFCLDDSGEKPVESGIGPSEPVYSDAHGRKFCDEWEPNSTSLFEGISPGWRDKYGSNLALQWVDISNVQPGSYQLREEVNPLGFVIEEPGANTPSFTPITIPGYVAQPQSIGTPFQTATPITLQASSFAPKSGAKYEVLSGPSHGSLTGSGSARTYTPEPGYTGGDSFTFQTREGSNPFPEHPQAATVLIGVGEPPPVPSVQITSAPGSLVVGTSGTLAAAAQHDTGAIEWSATGGATVKAEGLKGETASLTAPASAGTITVTARLADEPSATATREVTVLAATAPEPVPGIPTVTVGSGKSGGGVQGQQTAKPATLTKPKAMLVGRYLQMSTVPGVAGRVRLSAYRGRHLLGSCATTSTAGRTYTCRLELARSRLTEKLRVVASLRSGSRLYATSLGPERIPKMVMVKAGNVRVGAHGASYASVFWCSPSAAVAALGG